MATIKNIKKTLRVKECVNSLSLLSREYHEFVDVFSRRDSDILLSYRPYDYRVLVKENTKLPFSYLYSIL